MATARGEGPRRRIATVDDYADAQAVVDHLADRKFPVEQLSIVGEDLRYVEQVTGRVGYARAALQGLLSGAAVGAFVGFVLGLFTFFDPVVSGLVLALWGVVIGGVTGTVFGLLGHSLTGGRRDFSSVSAMRAGRYVVLADADVADDAEQILRQRT